VLRRIFGRKREEVAGGWRRLHNEELHNLYASLIYYKGDEVKEVEMEGACSMHGEMRNAYKIFIGKPVGKRLIGRPAHRWKDNISVDFSDIGWEDVDWIHLAQDRDQW
jgi:hypothetical protein